jgi:hypothetical protein
MRHHRRSAVLVAATLLVPVVLVLQSLFSLAAVGFEYAGERNRIEPRLARLQGLVDRQELIAQRSEDAVRMLSTLAYPAESDATALAAALQSDVRRIMDTAGLEVSNSQVMPVRRDDFFEQIPLKLTVKGSVTALNNALVDIAAFRPQLLVEAIDTFPTRGERRSDGQEAQQLTAVIQVFGLRARAS